MHMSVETLEPTATGEISDVQFDELWARLMDESGVVRPVILCNNHIQ